ncbi:MAG: hypothetical protein HOC89_04385 [Candidatus Thioglobus sp.]|uniref:hypothetical protein n=1 Tax=Candidatus Thioglobus sp. TaxID=2026721 RepID=UPI0025C437A0|nr:hypothetical protein [Candidatus Thioglobus sp.]MBT3276893.1 hypothetical protein [Candidatus Thioglobus sp.]MBT4422414.1 hypothetical protein [Candidatus Thioglobus sp.]
MLIIKYNLVALTLSLTSLLMVEGLANDSFASGNLLFLPMGASIFSYLLFGFGVLPGIAIANTLFGYFFWDSWSGLGFPGFTGHVVVGSLAPIAAMLMMRLFNLSNFFDGQKLNFRHVVFLVILTAFINTLSKFFIYMSVLPIAPDPAIFFSTYLIGDMLGGLVFVYVVSRISTFLIKQ